MSDFSGDVALQIGTDGADIIIENGLVISDDKLANSIILALWGGNRLDPGKSDIGKSWWGNLGGVPEANQIRSRFQNIVIGYPLTVDNAKNAIEAAKMDLKFLKDSGICDDYTVTGEIEGIKRLRVIIDMWKDGEKIDSSSYSFLWDGWNGIRE